LLTPAAAALVLLPLLVVSLTFSSFAGERDQGTLRPLLAVGVGRWSLLAGKALGALLPLITVMIPAAIIGGIVLYLNRPADPEAPIGARALGLLAVYVTHAVVWTGLGLAVSARARSQSTALVVLLALWFANAFVMPPAAMAIAKAVVPSPSAIEFAAAIDDEKAAWPNWDRRVDRVMERFLEGEFESTMAPMTAAGIITVMSGSSAPSALPASSDPRLTPTASSGRSVP